MKFLVEFPKGLWILASKCIDIFKYIGVLFEQNDLPSFIIGRWN